MTTTTSSGSNLRNRKQKQDHDGAAPALAEEPVDAAPPDGSALEEESSFRLTPLIKLPLYGRLDVLPFGLFYALLIGTDVYMQQENDIFARFVLSFVFGAALLGHLSLVLACQWNVSFQTLVGYKIASTKSHETWTHCFVKSKNSSRRDSNWAKDFQAASGRASDMNWREAQSSKSVRRAWKAFLFRTSANCKKSLAIQM